MVALYELLFILSFFYGADIDGLGYYMVAFPLFELLYVRFGWCNMNLIG